MSLFKLSSLNNQPKKNVQQHNLSACFFLMLVSRKIFLLTVFFLLLRPSSKMPSNNESGELCNWKWENHFSPVPIMYFRKKKILFNFIIQTIFFDFLLHFFFSVPDLMALTHSLTNISSGIDLQKRAVYMLKKWKKSGNFFFGLLHDRFSNNNNIAFHLFKMKIS